MLKWHVLYHDEHSGIANNNRESTGSNLKHSMRKFRASDEEKGRLNVRNIWNVHVI